MNPTTPSPDLLPLIQQVTQQLTQLVTRLATDLAHGPPTLAAVEQAVVPAIRDLGASLIAGLGARRIDPVPPRTVPCACGQAARYQRMRPATVTTVLGPVQIRRAYYWCAACHHGQAPDDATLQIVAGSVSDGLAEVMALLGATQDSFAEAAAVLARLTLVQVCANSIRQETEALGTALLASDTATAAAQQDVRTCTAPAVPAARLPRLYVSMDGIQVHFHAAGWGEVKVGCLYQTRTQPDHTHPEQVVIRLDQPSYCVQRGEPECFAALLWQEAVRRGVLHAEEVVVLGDGSAWIWGIAERHFAGATQILDWYHASSYLWDAANAIWPADAAKRTAWAQEYLTALWDGQVDTVLAALAAQRDAGDAVETTITYYTNQRSRMDYAAYRARGLQIGSGSIESACKQLVTSRLKGAGMIWDEAGAAAVATVRVYLKSDRWAEALARRPRRTRTYTRQHPRQAALCPVPPPGDAAAAAPTPPPVAPADSPRALPAAVREQVQAALAVERAHHPWRKPWSIRQQRRVATARTP